MSDEQPYILDISGVEGANRPSEPQRPERPWIGVQFDCCGIYTRIYRNAAGDAYEGFCPKCARPVHVKVGPGGTPQRLFRAR